MIQKSPDISRHSSHAGLKHELRTPPVHIAPSAAHDTTLGECPFKGKKVFFVVDAAVLQFVSERGILTPLGGLRPIIGDFQGSYTGSHWLLFNTKLKFPRSWREDDLSACARLISSCAPSNADVDSSEQSLHEIIENIYANFREEKAKMDCLSAQLQNLSSFNQHTSFQALSNSRAFLALKREFSPLDPRDICIDSVLKVCPPQSDCIAIVSASFASESLLRLQGQAQETIRNRKPWRNLGGVSRS